MLTARDACDGHASDGNSDDPAITSFRDEWGIDATFAQRGGMVAPRDDVPLREVWLLQRKTTKVGEGLARTTGWIRRTLLKKRGVKMLAGVEYVRIDDDGFHLRIDDEDRILDVDMIVICAGQESRREIVDGLRGLGIEHTIIGADVAVELDAKRAIEQGTRVALAL